MQLINPHIYPGRYKTTRKPYWLVKCQVPDPADPLRKESYQKKHPTPAEAERDRIRLIRAYGGGSLTPDEFKVYELAKHRLDTCTGDARGKSVLDAVDFLIANFKDQLNATRVSECVVLFRQEHVAQLRPESRDEYARYLEPLVERFGNLRIVEVSTVMLTEYVQASRCVSMAEIEKEGYNLNISRYIGTATEEAAVDLAVTHKKLVVIEQGIQTATRKHNEFLAQLGLPPLPPGDSDGKAC